MKKAPIVECQKFPVVEAKTGLTVVTAVSFLAADVVGSGVLALPQAISNIGWESIILMTVFCLAAGYSGCRLADCWTILEDRYPELKGHIRDPYPMIGLKAYGRKGEIAARIATYIHLFGSTIVYVLLASESIYQLLKNTVSITSCEWALIIFALLIPVGWLGSPKDFWWMAMAALLTSILTVICGVTQMILYGYKTINAAAHPTPTFGTVCLSLGAIIFSFGGASAFPTVQNDMKDKTKFFKSVIIGFGIILFLYLLVSIPGYILLGANVDDNFLDSLVDGPLVVAARVSIAVHLMLALMILFNPGCQDVEERLNVPDKFGWKRVVLRTLLVILLAFIGESIPEFGKILNLIGAFAVTLTSFVLPTTFYMALCKQKDPSWPERHLSRLEQVCLWTIIVVGIIGGIVSTYSAIKDIVSESTFVPPCYISNK